MAPKVVAACRFVEERVEMWATLRAEIARRKLTPYLSFREARAEAWEEEFWRAHTQ